MIPLDEKNHSKVFFMRREKIDISKVHPNEGQIEGLPANLRLIKDGRFKKLMKSIQDLPEMTEARDLLVYPYDGDYVVIGGNMRLRAYQELGWKEVPCCVLPDNMPVDKLREMVIQDNNPFGETDWNMIANEWDVEELKDWGVDLPADWDTSEAEEQKEAEEDDFSDEDAEKAEPRVKLGEIWQLGEHRLMCGDSTDATSVALLMDGKKADMVFTDPPYGMSAVSKSGVLQKRYKTDIMNDDTNEVAINSFKLCQKMFSNAKQVWWGANYYTECLPSSECWIVWDKNNGASDQTDCELAWANFRSVVRQFTMASEKKDRVHPTQKPIKLITDIIDKFEKDKRFDVIVDLFGGSGSTLIACEQLKRKCYMMELSEHYASVIIARWEKLTGKEAVKVYG